MRPRRRAPVALLAAAVFAAIPTGASAQDAGDGSGPDRAAPRAPVDRGSRWFEQAPPDPQALAADPEAFAAQLAEQGLLIDPAARSVTVRGGTLHDRESLGYPVEYLVVNEHGRTHEAAFLVKAIPSVLDACVRAMGLEPGEPTQVFLKDPLPPEEEIADGRVSPWEVTAGHGPLVAITVAWADDEGVRHDAPLETMLLDVRSDTPLPELGWIYVGSRRGQLRQGRELIDVFMADVDGNVAAIYLDGRGTSLFERNSLDGLDDRLYTINPAAMPPRGMPVTLTIRPLDRSVAPAAPEDASTAEASPPANDDSVDPSPR